jgi:hypothetical protein
MFPNPKTASVIQKIRQDIATQEAIELEAGMSDVHFASVSFNFARENLDKVWKLNSPEEYLQKYQALLENRYRRLTDEDSGEFGSGRDALGFVLTRVEELVGELKSNP